MIRIEKPQEIWGEKGWKYGCCVGAKLINFEILDGPEGSGSEGVCAMEEIFLDFDNGKEMRIYIDPEDGALVVSTD